MPEKSLVIGGGGFIGRRVVRALIADGRSVVVAGRRPRSLVEIPEGAEYIELDYGKPETLRDVLPQCQAILDLAYAATPKANFSDPLADLQLNVFPSVGLFESIIKSKWSGRLLVVSSGGTVYGQAAKLPLKEDSPTVPISPYGITKLVIERYADMYFRLFGLNVVVVRPANAYGIGQQPFTGQGFVATAMGCIAQRKPVTVFGEAGTIRDYVHVNDVADGIVAALDSGRAGNIYNLGSGTGRTNIEILKMLSALVAQDGFNVEVDIGPARGFDVSANVLDSSKLSLECGWQPRMRFEDGLDEMWCDIRPRYDL